MEDCTLSLKDLAIIRVEYLSCGLFFLLKTKNIFLIPRLCLQELLHEMNFLS